jgi:hypothetical protein
MALQQLLVEVQPPARLMHPALQQAPQPLRQAQLPPHLQLPVLHHRFYLLLHQPHLPKPQPQLQLAALSRTQLEDPLSFRLLVSWLALSFSDRI